MRILRIFLITRRKYAEIASHFKCFQHSQQEEYTLCKDPYECMLLLILHDFS